MKYRPLIPMGAITGAPTKEDLHRNLEQYLNAGINQFMIYARSGLEVEYMGPEWLEICRHIIEYAHKHDMAIWIYDEYNWPSGRCKGKVIQQNEDFALKKLVAFADHYFGDGKEEKSPRKYYWTKINIPLYADILNPDAMECFISLTHEVYYKHFGQYFGNTIKGFFTDEPSFMYAATHTVSGNALEAIYYNGLENDYRDLTGRELLTDFELYLSGKVLPELWSAYYFLLGNRFRNAFMGKIRAWCDAKGVLFTGHLLHENLPWNSIKANGDPVAAMRAFSMPGIDEICSFDKFSNIEWGTFKLLESAIPRPGLKAIAELFALGPSDMTFAKMREIIYLAALHGVNHFVTAVSALDARGNVIKPYYYNPIAPAQPWFCHIGQLNEEAANAAALTEKPSTAKIALRYPQKAFCANWNPEHAPVLKIDYLDLIRGLLNAQWEFRVISHEETPDENYSVVLSLNNDGVLEEHSGKQMMDIQEILDFLESSLKRRSALKYKNGRLVKNILLKTFDDGSHCIVNTSGKYLKNVSLDGTSFNMPIHDVKVFPHRREVTGKTLALSSYPFFCSLEDNNTLRPVFADKQNTTFECETDTILSFHLREHNGPVKIKLDGVLISPDRKCDSLPEGIKNLYRSTSLTRLGKGIHKLELVNDAKELPYLPLVFIAGKFAVSQNKTIKNLPKKALIADFFKNNLCQYAGTVVFTNTLNLSGCSNLTLDYKGMAIEILIDGHSLGTRLWAPYIWTVPQKLKRRDAKVEIRIKTSIGPIFADYPKGSRENTSQWLLSTFWPRQNVPVKV
ncbi:MAG: hypothetical protein WC082_06650 [Victivallales bacterium]